MSVAPPRSGPQRLFQPPRWDGTSLPSGLELRATRWGKRPTVAISVLFPYAGSAYDPPGFEGLAEVVAEAFLSGTRRLAAPALAEALDDLAAVAEVSAGFDTAVARLFVLERDLDEGLALLAEILSEPSFRVDEVEKIRRRQLDLLDEQRAEPEFLARDRFLRSLYPGHPYGRLAATAAGLGALTAADVISFARERYRAAGTSIVLAGDASPDLLLAVASRRLEAVGEPGPPPEALPSPAPQAGHLAVHLVDRPGSAQAAFLFGRSAPLRAEPPFLASAVAANALGGGASSRLFRILREERALTYGAFASLSPRRCACHLVASVDSRHEAAGEAVNGLLDLLSEFAAEGPTDVELRRSQDFLVGSFALASETPGAVVEDEVGRILHRLDEDESATLRKRLRALSPEDVRRAAAGFSSDQGVLVAVGRAESLRGVLSALGPVTESKATDVAT